MTETFTPGPWQYIQDKWNHPYFAGPDNWGVLVGDGGEGFHVSVADAHLIAAAPDLYAVVEEFARLNRTMTVSEIMDAAHAALKKARGET
jgi:hypothetical protein